MTQEQIEQYKSINEIFYKECERVAKILSDYDVYTERYETSNIQYAGSFSLNGDDIYWDGDEYWVYDECKNHNGDFPVSYLTMTDNELRAVAKRENDAYLKELREKEEKKKQTPEDIYKL